MLSAVVALAGPVDACKHIFGMDPPPPTTPVYTGRVAIPAYGVAPMPPTLPLDAGAEAATDASRHD